MIPRHARRRPCRTATIASIHTRSDLLAKLIAQISAGRIPAGSFLPSERLLAEHSA